MGGGPWHLETRDHRCLFLDTLEAAKTTVVSCGETVHPGTCSPLDAIASPLGNGGRACAEADTWITEMTGQCAGVVEAFNDAVAHIQAANGREVDPVPQNEPHGLAGTRQWHIQRHNP